MQLQCPECQQELQRSGVLQRRCESCQIDYKLHANCDKCGELLERLAACGAVNYWCNSCNELKSKSTAIYSLHKIEAE